MVRSSKPSSRASSVSAPRRVPAAPTGSGRAAKPLDAATLAAVKEAQRNELTEHHIYLFLASRAEGKNRGILARIAEDELQHCRFYEGLSGEKVAPRAFHRWWYVFLARLFGLTFALRLMERGEDLAQQAYRELRHIPGIDRIIKDEERHEDALIGMLEDERLEYAGSIVLGLNDALVELTGALAGLTFALQDARLVAMAGMITGFAASLSMAASGYLQGKEEADQNASKSPIKAALYTGVTYLVTVLILVAPFLLLPGIYGALAVTLLFAVLVVASYTFYISVAKGLRFWRRFAEMALISLTVAALSFGVGLLLRTVFGIEA